VPDYGYYGWLFHPVSPTIFPSLWLSCMACYGHTFLLFIRLFRRIVFLNEVPARLFDHLFCNDATEEKRRQIRKLPVPG
jgi:hypothetical protein